MATQNEMQIYFMITTGEKHIKEPQPRSSLNDSNSTTIVKTLLTKE